MVIPNSVHRERIEQNLDVFGFESTDDEMANAIITRRSFMKMGITGAGAFAAGSTLSRKEGILVYYRPNPNRAAISRAILNSDKTESGGTELMEFIGRERELTKIKKKLNTSGQHNVLVYGRRRVGKSELIKQAITDIPGSTAIYYECRQTSEEDNLASLSTLAAEALGFPPLAFSSVRELLEFLFSQAKDRRITLVLDEYPYLRDAVKGLDSIMQTSIDTHRESSSLSIVLCGSYVEIMKSLIEHESPLYGRIDLALELKPMDYYDAAKFYPDFSPEDKVRLYSVFGGIPYYNRLVDQALSVRENIIELMTEPGARLENEIPSYLGAEISKMTNANEVFGTLAQGYSRWGDVLAQSHVSSGPAMSDVLEKLISLELVQKRAPINDPTNRRKSGYFIIDPLSLFYYRYVFRNASSRQLLDPEVFFVRYVSQDFEENYVPHMFEEVCRQYLVRQNRAGSIEPPFDAIGKYWYDDPANKVSGEFDVVTQDPKGYVFYEVKFRKTPITQKMVDEEISQVEATGLKCHRYGFFSRSRFTAAESESTAFIDLAQMFE